MENRLAERRFTNFIEIGENDLYQFKYFFSIINIIIRNSQAEQKGSSLKNEQLFWIIFDGSSLLGVNIAFAKGLKVKIIKSRIYDHMDVKGLTSIVFGLQ